MRSSGLFTDEFTIAETFPDRIDIDRHTINATTVPENDGLTLNFRQLHKARVAAEQAASDYAQFDAGNAKHAEVLALAGYTYVMFAEDFCSGVPFSTLDASGNPQDPGSASARVDMQFQERAFWLQLTAHRLGDIRREVKYFNKPASALYPSGAYPKGGTYGTDLVLPIPFDEVNNPDFKQCLDKGV